MVKQISHFPVKSSLEGNDIIDDAIKFNKIRRTCSIKIVNSLKERIHTICEMKVLFSIYTVF